MRILDRSIDIRERGCIAFVNTDSKLLISFIEDLRKEGIENEDLEICLTLYDRLQHNNIIMYWSKMLAVPLERFAEPMLIVTPKGAIKNATGIVKIYCKFRDNTENLSLIHNK